MLTLNKLNRNSVTVKETDGDGQIYGRLLVGHWDLIASLVLILGTSRRKANLFGYIIKIKNNLVFLNSTSIKVVMIEIIKELNLICNLL